MKRYIWCVIPILYEDAPIVQERTAKYAFALAKPLVEKHLEEKK
ncbi:hypothetical protein [Nostoc sp.]